MCGPGEGAGAERCYTCPSGEYNLNGDGVCRQCPQGAVCSGGTGVALTGTDSDEYYRTVRTYGPLWIGYRAGCWWHELVNLLRRILIIGLFVGLDSPNVRPEQDGFVSKAFMAAFCLILCIAHMVIQPFETAMDNHVEGFMLAALTAVPIIDYARTRASYEDSNSFIAVEAVLLYFPVFAGLCGYFSRRYNKTSDEQKIISKAEA